jgi:SAM-dependent methyltransferase
MTILSALKNWANPPAQASVVAPVAIEPPNPWTGLKDAVMRGWFNQATGELFTGFAVGPGDVVADIGCGGGGNARFCATRGAKLLLADINPDCVAGAAAKIAALPDHAPFETFVTDSDPLPIADEAATRVICTEVIEHVDSPARLLAELVRIGKPGARYLITCPAPEAEAIQARIAPPSYFKKPNHLRIIPCEDLARWAEEAGLVIEAQHTYGFYSVMWWTLFWACDIPVGASHPVLDHWTRCWHGLLDLPDGAKTKHALDDLLPKSQMIIATKPV